MEVMELLQITKDTSPLAPEVLRDVGPLQLGEVVLPNVTQSLHIFPLCGQQLLHDLLQFPAPENKRVKVIEQEDYLSFRLHEGGKYYLQSHTTIAVCCCE